MFDDRSQASDRMTSLVAEDLLKDLIGFNSVSHLSNEAITKHVESILQSLGFVTEVSSYLDRRGVAKFNLVAKRASRSTSGSNIDLDSATESSGLAYFCHTDVVSADRWRGPGGDPFEVVVEDGRLYGRGACDMKGSLAAMLQAASAVDADEQTGPLWVVCTADEEVGLEGARKLVGSSDAFREIVVADPISIIGEPTKLRVVYMHKGMVGLRIHSQGKAAHSSTSEGTNANVAMVPMLQKLLEIDQRCREDESLHDDRFDPPTLSWNFGVSDHMNAFNIVPDHCTAWVSFRTMPKIDGQALVDEVVSHANDLGLEVESFPGVGPMETQVDEPCLQEMCELASNWVGPNEPIVECYATDGCELRELTKRVVCGPGSIAQAHKADEFITLDELHRGAQFYEAAIRRFAGT